MSCRPRCVPLTSSSVLKKRLLLQLVLLLLILLLLLLLLLVQCFQCLAATASRHAISSPTPITSVQPLVRLLLVELLSLGDF